MLYFQREYNVDCFTSNPLSQETNVALKLVNVLIKALNNKELIRLPRIIVFVPDWDIVKSAAYFKSGAKRFYDVVLNWVMLHAERAIEAKRDNLARRRPGSVVYSEPKIIWPKMIERVGGEYDRALTVRYRFNAALEDQLASRKKHYIIDVGKKIADSNYYTNRNQLNGDGAHIYWREVDKWIEEFDHDKEKLKPIKQTQFLPTKRNSQHKRSPHKVHSSIAKRSPHIK